MPSLMELVEQVNRGEGVEPQALETYQTSPNSAEAFLANHAHALLDLRESHRHMAAALEAIDFADRKVLEQFLSIAGFLGQTDRRAAAVAKFGGSAIGRREFALGLEAIQNGLAFDAATHGGAWAADRDNALFVAQQYDRAGAGLGWYPAEPIEHNNKLTKLAYVVSSLADDEAAARAAASLARHLDAKRFKLTVYSTEAGARRDKQAFAQPSYAGPSAKRGREITAKLASSKAGAWHAPTDGDAATAARSLADQLVADKADVVLFDAALADPVAAVVAGWDVARVKIDLARRGPLFAGGVDGVVYHDAASLERDKEFWRGRGVEAAFVVDGVDVEAEAGPAPQRSGYGIPDNAVVFATAGEALERTVTGAFVEAVIDLLRAHPQAIYLLIGGGDLSAVKRKFESAGVGKRVGYAGKRKDLPGFLRIADLYLAEFPAAGTEGVLQAMAAERPVVAMRTGDAPEESAAAELVGPEAAVHGRDANAFVERVSKLARDAGYRHKLGHSMRARLEEHYGFNQTARQLERLCDDLIGRRSESTVTMSESVEVPVAEEKKVA